MSGISIKNVVKKYGDNVVIPDLSVEIEEGELFTLLGPSGCGKTTLLRMIAGFNSIEGGDIYFNEERINDKDPSKRNIGMVFQNYAIFPHLSVRDNVAFGLKNRKLDKQTIQEKTDEYLNLMQIMEYADRMPSQLSGGQQQRIALARALVITPDVLLMDEPLSNLDAKLRLEMRTVIRHTQKNVGILHTNTLTQDSSTEAIDEISDAIAYVSKIRSDLGAYQNRLEHATKNLDTTYENMTSAYSRIMDVDMAEEMTNYSSLQVLTQAGTSMLAQANERPSQVLQLLQ